MLEMRMCTDAAELNRTCEQAGISVPGVYMMELLERGERLGYCLWSQSGEEMAVLSLTMTEEDPALADGLLRGALNSANLSGVRFARLGQVREKLILCEKLQGAAGKDGTLDLEEFLSGCPGCSGCS